MTPYGVTILVCVPGDAFHSDDTALFQNKITISHSQNMIVYYCFYRLFREWTLTVVATFVFCDFWRSFVQSPNSAK